MSDHLDDLIRGHVARRSAGAIDADTTERLVASIMKSVDLTPKRRPRLPLSSRLTRLRLVIATVAAGALVVALAMSQFVPSLRPGSSLVAEPGATGAPELQVLTVRELRRILDPAHIGEVAVVDGNIETAYFDCFNPPCPIGWLMQTDHEVLVWQDRHDTQPFIRRLPSMSIGGPIAVRISGVNSIELIGQLETNVGHELVWPVRALGQAFGGLFRFDRLVPAGQQVQAGALFVVDGWLVEAGGVPGCHPIVGAPPPELEAFTCGNPSWLTADPVSPGMRTPEGIRVPNGAYMQHAMEPGSDSSGKPIPRRALYLVRPLLAPAFDCYLCPPDGIAMVIARMDPIAIP